VDVGRRRCGAWPGRRSGLHVPQVLLQKLKVLHHLLELLFGGRGIAPPAPLDDPGVDQGPESDNENKRSSISHKRLKVRVL
jgi:hypothetical protein